MPYSRAGAAQGHAGQKTRIATEIEKSRSRSVRKPLSVNKSSGLRGAMARSVSLSGQVDGKRLGSKGHYQPRYAVRDDPEHDAGKESDQHPDQAHDGRIDVHVIGQAAADSSDFAIRGGAHQALLDELGGGWGRLLTRATVVAEIRIFGDVALSFWAIHGSLLHTLHQFEPLSAIRVDSAKGFITHFAGCFAQIPYFPPS